MGSEHRQRRNRSSILVWKCGDNLRPHSIRADHRGGRGRSSSSNDTGAPFGPSDPRRARSFGHVAAGPPIRNQNGLNPAKRLYPPPSRTSVREGGLVWSQGNWRANDVPRTKPAADSPRSAAAGPKTCRWPHGGAAGPFVGRAACDGSHRFRTAQRPRPCCSGTQDGREPDPGSPKVSDWVSDRSRSIRGTRRQPLAGRRIAVLRLHF